MNFEEPLLLRKFSVHTNITRQPSPARAKIWHEDEPRNG